MAQVDAMLENVFVEPEHCAVLKEKETAATNYRKRYQLLDYEDVISLSDVMETTVPIDGKGNFPSLEVTPSSLVQMVRDGLSKEGIRVPNVRLNGSAATHVLSGGGKHPYKDLDLIFAVDLSEYTDRCTCGAVERNYNINNNNTYCRTKGFKLTSKKNQPASQKPSPKAQVTDRSQDVPSRVQSPTATVDLPFDPEIPDQKGPTTTDSLTTSCSSSPQTVSEKNMDLDLEDIADKDSGYTSSGSSVASLPVSPAGSWVHPIRSRTHSLDSSSSIASSSSSGQLITRHKDGLDVYTRNGGIRQKFIKDFPPHHEFCLRSKEACWQKIKDVVMTILRELLPVGVSRTRMTDAVLTDAYVQKMVKITTDIDRWSLISLNNDAGRNLELKFVENMRRKYEFSVDSFQIILDSYQRFKIVSNDLEKSEEIKLSTNFFPSVLAESVYGDFGAALRHLHHRRICTQRPEEIRGGGLLRYCNLLVRDFTPGEVEGHENGVCNDEICDEGVELQSHNPSPIIEFRSQSYTTSDANDVRRLEQLMCSRFFIDFSEFPRQQQKLLTYLDSHFANEDELKFQYLLLVRRVVDKGTVCLMSNERTLIIDFITKLARETLAKNVNSVSQYNQGQFQHGSKPKMPLSPFVTYRNNCPIPAPHYQPQHNSFQSQMFQNNPWGNNANNSNSYSPQYLPPNVPPPPYTQQHFCLNQDPNYYPPQNPNLYPQCGAYQMPQQQPPVPVAICPSCHTTYPQMQCNPQYCNENPCNPHVVVTPPRHTMDVNSVPFYPASKSNPNSQNVSFHVQGAEHVVYLPENAKLYYTAAPITNIDNSKTIESEKHSTDQQVSTSEVTSHS